MSDGQMKAATSPTLITVKCMLSDICAELKVCSIILSNLEHGVVGQTEGKRKYGPHPVGVILLATQCLEFSTDLLERLRILARAIVPQDSSDPAETLGAKSSVDPTQLMPLRSEIEVTERKLYGCTNLIKEIRGAYKGENRSGSDLSDDMLSGIQDLVSRMFTYAFEMREGLDKLVIDFIGRPLHGAGTMSGTMKKAQLDEPWNESMRRNAVPVKDMSETDVHGPGVGGRMKKLYFAGPLFSKGERDYNVQCVKVLGKYFDVFLPQREVEDPAKLLLEKGMTPEEVTQRIFKADCRGVRECDIVLMVLDGRVLDEGACWEVGYGFAHGKTIWGLKTDGRRVAAEGSTLMVDQSIERVFNSVEDIDTQVKGFDGIDTKCGEGTRGRSRQLGD